MCQYTDVQLLRCYLRCPCTRLAVNFLAMELCAGYVNVPLNSSEAAGYSRVLFGVLIKLPRVSPGHIHPFPGYVSV